MRSLTIAGRSHSRLHALWLAFALLVTSCGGDETALSKEAMPLTAIATAQPTREPVITIIPLGRTAISESAEITIHDVRRSDNEGGESTPAGFTWLLLDLSVQHLGPEALPLAARLIHTDGREFERARPPGVSAELDAPLAAGAGARGEIAFLVETRMVGGILIYGLGEERWALELGMPKPGE